MFLSAMIDFCHGQYEQRLHGARYSAVEFEKVRSEYLAWQHSIGPDADEALPEPDVRNRAELARWGYQWTGALVHAATNRVMGREVEAVGLDSDMLLAQMVAAAAVPL